MTTRTSRRRPQREKPRAYEQSVTESQFALRWKPKLGQVHSGMDLSLFVGTSSQSEWETEVGM